MPLLQELRPNDIRSEHSGQLDQVNHPVSPSVSQHMQQALAWSGSGRQTEDRIELAQSDFHAQLHMLTTTKSWTAYCSDSDESDTSYSIADGGDSSLLAGQDSGPSKATLA